MTRFIVSFKAQKKLMLNQSFAINYKTHFLITMKSSNFIDYINPISKTFKKISKYIEQFSKGVI